MVRAAAKNYRDVTVVVHPERYNEEILAMLVAHDCELSVEYNFELMREAFRAAKSEQQILPLGASRNASNACAPAKFAAGKIFGLASMTM